MSNCLQPLKSCFLGSKDESKSTPPTTADAKAPPQQQAPATTPSVEPSTKMSSTAKVAVLVYSMYGHAAKLAEHAVEGLKEAGVEYKVYQIPETLPTDVLGKMHANKAPIESFPEVQPDDLKAYDGFVFAFPTRYGRAPAQVSAFFDRTGGLWASGALIGKFATIITSTASQHGGLESTQLTTLPFLVHHGINFVPIGYSFMGNQGETKAVIGSSAYGAGTVAGGDGSLQPDSRDLEVAKGQGAHFARTVKAYVKGKEA